MRNNNVWLLRVVKGDVKLVEYSSSSPSHVLEKKLKKKRTKRAVVIAGVSALILALTLNLVFAAVIEENLHLNIQTTNSTGGIVTGTYAFVFNISTASDCSAVVYTDSASLTTDSRGIISHYMENVSLDYDQQYWLCYYRDGTLKNASKIARTPYTFRARNVTISGLEADANLNMSSYNITADYGFFSNLGSLLNRVTNLFVQDINASGDINFTGLIYGNGSQLTDVSADLLDGYNSSFFMPLNTSVTGTFDFNGGWMGGGLSIDGGDLYAQTVYVYNITSLNVTEQDLTITDDLVVFGNTELKKNLTVDTDTLFVDSNTDMVGIGTTNPEGNLHVFSSSAGSVTPNTVGDELVVEGGSSGTGISILGTDTSEGFVLFGSPSDDDGGMVRYAHATGLWQFYAGGNVQLQLQKVQAKLTNGVAASPSWTFINDNSTGIFLGAGNDDLGFSIKGSEMMRIETSGEVGINTTTPNNLLHLLSPSAANIEVETTGTNTDAGVILDTNTENWQLYVDDSESAFKIYNGTADVFDIEANGNVGINTTTPQNMLNVVGDANVTGAFYLLNSKCASGDVLTANTTTGLISCVTDQTGGGGGGASPWTNDSIQIFVDLAGGYPNYINASDALFVNGTSGNVGIGTSSPGNLLMVEGTEGPLISGSISGLGRLAFIGVMSTGGNRMYLGANSSGTEALVITQGGNVGIGTTNPTQQFEIMKNQTSAGGVLSLYNGEATINSNDDVGTILFKGMDSADRVGAKIIANVPSSWASNVNQAETDLEFYTQDSTTTDTLTSPRMIIDEDGNVGIGTSSPVSLLQIWNDDSTAFNASVDDGQDGEGATLTITNQNTTNQSFAQLNLQVSGSSGRGEARIVAIRTASATSDMAFVTENANTKSEKMRILSSGNVGIGTTNPTSPTHGSAVPVLKLEGSQPLISLNDTNGIEFEIVSQANTFYIYDTTNTSQRFTINPIGNVGIGTTTPDERLTILTPTGTDKYAVSIMRQAGSVAALYLGANSDNSAIIGSNNADLRLGRDLSGTFTEYVRILNSDGSVGIGLTGPSNRLEVNGSIETDGLLDTDASNFFEVSSCGADTGVSSVSSAGTITCTADSAHDGTGTDDQTFAEIGAGTATVAFLMGTGGSLGTSGSGTITATAVPWSGVTGEPDFEEESHCSEHDGTDLACSGETLYVSTDFEEETHASEHDGTCLTASTDVLGVTADCIGDTQLAYNTGQHLTTTSSPTFTKVNADAYDPIYNILGTKYATYLPGMTGGIKEEVTGTVNLNSDYTIDFKNLEFGSDLWLFYQVTDFGNKMENLQIILTPSFNGNVWYKKDPLKKALTIYGNQAGEVSYRFTANRFDWMNWSTYYEGENTGIVVPLK